MRILHCSDLHANRTWFDWIAKAASDYDLVCVTGDHLDLTDFQTIDAQIAMVRTVFENFVTPVALVSGNNDSFNADGAPLWLLHAKWLTDLRRPGCWIDGDEFEQQGIRIRCIGWHAPLPTAAPGSEIWLYHAPPARTPLAVSQHGEDVGDEMLREVCYAKKGPSMVLSGHQHHPRHWLWCIGGTWNLNAGQGHYSSVPNHIVVDTTQNTVALHRGDGSIQQIHMGYPA